MNNIKSTPNFSNRPQARGAALIICLIILLVASFIATRGATTADLQVSMARAEQYGLYVFDLARSELIGQFRAIEEDQGDIVAVLNLPEDTPYDVTDGKTMQPDSAYQQTIEYTFKGEGRYPKGYSVDKFTSYHFTVRSNAEVAQTATQSDQTMGLTYLAPK